MEVVFSAGKETTEINYGDTSSWGTNEYANGDYSQVTDWDNFDQTQVPADRVKDIPANRVKVNDVKDQSKLTKDQVLHNKNYNKIENVDKLSREVRDAVLKEKSKEEVESETNNIPTKSEIFDDGFWFDSIFDIRIGNIGFHEAEGLSYRNVIIKVDKAKTIFIRGGLLSDVTDFEGGAIEFDVGGVRVVTNKCVTMYNVSNSHFRIDDKNIEVSPEEGISLTLKTAATLKQLLKL